MNNGTPLIRMLLVLFIGLKLTDSITWNWGLVLIPLWIVLVYHLSKEWLRRVGKEKHNNQKRNEMLERIGKVINKTENKN